MKERNRVREREHEREIELDREQTTEREQVSLNEQGTEKRESGGSPDSPGQERESLLYFLGVFSGRGFLTQPYGNRLGYSFPPPPMRDGTDPRGYRPKSFEVILIFFFILFFPGRVIGNIMILS